MPKKSEPEDVHNRATNTFALRQTTMLEFPVVVPLTVRWGDMDAFGHVNNSVYFRYFEQARIAYFQSTLDESAATPTGIGPILHSTSCRFRAPVKHPDTLQVGARVKEVLEDRLVMVYRIYSDALDGVVAEGEATIVAFDYDAEKKANVPQEWLERMEAVERRPLRPKS